MIRNVLIVIGALVIVLAAVFIWDPTYMPGRVAEVYLYTRGARHHQVMVDGYRIHYIEAKPPAGMPERPLVLVHGLGGQANDWAPMMPELAKAGFHIYAIDLLGYGRSQAPLDSTYSLTAESDILVHFMDQVKLKRPDVAGWSMGGWITMMVAINHPERIRRMVLLDSAGVYFPLDDADLSLFTPADGAGLERLIRRLEPDKPFISVPKWAAPGMLRRFRNKDWVIRRSFSDMIDGHELLDFKLDRVQAPTLIEWGTEDKLIPFESGQRIHQLIPNSVLIGVPGCGHLAPGECWRQMYPGMVNYLNAPEPPKRNEFTVAGPDR